MAFFELANPRDMFQKAERELQRLQTDFTIDNVFNFFVTAYHIQDYVRTTSSVPQVDLEAFLKDVDLQDCRDLCDKGKHVRLTKRADPTTAAWSGAISGAPMVHYRSEEVQNGFCYQEIEKSTSNNSPRASSINGASSWVDTVYKGSAS